MFWRFSVFASTCFGGRLVAAWFFVVMLSIVFCGQSAFAASPGKAGAQMPKKDWRQVLLDAKQLPPTIAENEVRVWIKTLKFSGYRLDTVFNEFHPDDGNLVATFKNGAKMLYVSYVDHNRMSPFGFKRGAKDMVTVGTKRTAKDFDIKGWKWHGDDASKPILAADVALTVKIVLLGYSGLNLADMQKLALEVPLDNLAKLAKK